MAKSSVARATLSRHISPGSINFGEVCRGTVVDRTLTTTDTGTAPLTITGVSMGGGSSPALSVLPIPSLPQTLAVSDGLDFTLRLGPPASSIAGPISGSVVVASDDPASPASVRRRRGLVRSDRRRVVRRAGGGDG